MNGEIVAGDVGVSFLFDRQRRVMTPLVARIRRSSMQTWGLRHVSATLGPGEGVALLGKSGSGKTTLLRVAAGVLGTDEGQIRVTGRVASVLSTTGGLMLPLTGRENAAMLLALAGMPPVRADAAVAAVRDVSGLGAAFDRPVLSYSQGMRARLGFAVAEQTQPDVLLLDEVHEALDHEFRERVASRAEAIIASGGVVVAAGHDHELLGGFCGRALLLADGTVAADGAFADIRRAYAG